MCVDSLKKTRKPACTIVDVLPEIERATVHIRHKKIRRIKCKEEEEQKGEGGKKARMKE